MNSPLKNIEKCSRKISMPARRAAAARGKRAMSAVGHRPPQVAKAVLAQCLQKIGNVGDTKAGRLIVACVGIVVPIVASLDVPQRRIGTLVRIAESGQTIQFEVEQADAMAHRLIEQSRHPIELRRRKTRSTPSA